ncbi:hypothetical protein SAMN02745244_03527 [Tessaracoccus bendigoensis DSM 12906]|uniref:Uncharacterized protein n=1 Tax=Tessaracoccus bendigoensis DSM 12906 TaxID=1123357 RepID=A0A1M6N1V0_9ACTN|nr:hypothetical protein [Tessaracoccus bendigoensis]SHJ89654.1 hypothetical protein SAMN02745244_03527 [Tessaracoccus bendigoensis DSM 12906]
MTLDAIPTTEYRHLVGWGEVAWAKLIAAAWEQDLICAWADYDGFRIGPCPSSAPPYGHVWGWSKDGGTLMRGRVNGSDVTVGWLHRDYREGGCAVPCVSRDMVTWDPAYDRIRPRLANGTSIPSKMVMIEVLDGMPVTFVGAG